MTRFRLVVAALGIALAGPGTSAQLQQTEHQTTIDSGVRLNTGPARATVFSEVVAIKGSKWVRLEFSEADLPDGTTLEILSLADGGTQRLDAETIEQWGFTSAYFNGDAVLVELIAEPGSPASRVAIDHVWAGGPSLAALGTPGLCDGTDDRFASNDPRVGRILPTLCSAWIADDCAHCLITDGLCSTNGAVVSFNVPASEPGCDIVFASPDDQYTVDFDSVQSGFSSGPGGNWTYFGVFPNSNTGLPLAEAQGAFFTRAQTVPPPGAAVSLVGFGGTEGCADFSQSSSTGTLGAADGYNVAFRADAATGDFGGPVVLEDTGEVIGMLSYVGCDLPIFGGNLATLARSDAATIDSLESAIANPLGICVPPEPPAFGVAGGLPRIIPPAGAPISVTITAQPPIVLDPSTAVARVESAGGAIDTPLAFVGNDTFTGTLPLGACGEDAFIRIAIDAQPTNLPAKTYRFPSDVPFRGVYADGAGVLASFDMETDPGWMVTGTASAGAWELAVPGNFGRGDPSADADGSGRAYVTDNGANQDLDGGPIRLTTTTYDLSQLDDPELLVSVYHFTSAPDRDLGADPLDIEASADGGATWTLLDRRLHTGEWRDLRYPLAGAIDVSGDAVFRFTAVDEFPQSIVESAIDAVQIRSVVCNECLADTNGDGFVTPADFNGWILAFNSQSPACDQNNDGLCTPADYNAWILNYNAGC